MKALTYGGYSFTGPQMSAMDLLSQGLSQAETARHIGCSKNTVYNWMKKPEFRAAMREKQKEEVQMRMIDADSSTKIARQDYRGLAYEAVNIYKRSLSANEEDRPDSAQLKAAKDIIDHAFGKAPFSIDTATGVAGAGTKNETIVEINFWKSANTLILDEENEYIPPPEFKLTDDGKKKE